MACPFCATGQGGLQRNMSTAEIVEQVVAGARSLARGEVPGGPGRISNVVFMGMGEPMANYKAVIGAVRRLTDPAPDGLGMSARGITVCTVGLVPRINQLAEEGIPVTLALSLHAPDDELRNELVPINTRWKVGEAVEAAWNYARTTKRRVSIEYAMMRGINDQALARRPARRRAELLRRLGLGARQPDPAEPDARLEVDRVATRPTSASSSAGSRPRASRPPCATPAAARSTAPAASSPRTRTEPQPAAAERAGAGQVGIVSSLSRYGQLHDHHCDHRSRKGLGAAVARRFGKEGFAVGLISRHQGRSRRSRRRAGAGRRPGEGFVADVRDPASMRSALEQVTETLGPIEVLQYSPLPQKDFMRPVLETTPADLRGTRSSSRSTARSRRCTRSSRACASCPRGCERRSILFVNGGSAVKPGRNVTGTSVAFAGQAAYAELLHEVLGEEGIYVGQLIIGGRIIEGDEEKDPAVLADRIFALHTKRDAFATTQPLSEAARARRSAALDVATVRPCRRACRPAARCCGPSAAPVAPSFGLRVVDRQLAGQARPGRPSSSGRRGSRRGRRGRGSW